MALFVRFNTSKRCKCESYFVFITNANKIVGMRVYDALEKRHTAINAL